MKVKELVAFLQTLNQEATLLWADYYYDGREGFSEKSPDVSKCVVTPSESIDNKHLVEQEPAYLVDFNYFP